MVARSLQVLRPINDAFCMLGAPQPLVTRQISNTSHLPPAKIWRFFARLALNFDEPRKHEALCAIFLVSQCPCKWPSGVSEIKHWTYATIQKFAALLHTEAMCTRTNTIAPVTHSNLWKHTCFHYFAIYHQNAILDRFKWISDTHNTLKWSQLAPRRRFGTSKELSRQHKYEPSNAKDFQRAQGIANSQSRACKTIPNIVKVRLRNMVYIHVPPIYTFRFRISIIFARWEPSA